MTLSFRFAAIWPREMAANPLSAGNQFASGTGGEQKN